MYACFFVRVCARVRAYVRVCVYLGVFGVSQSHTPDSFTGGLTIDMVITKTYYIRSKTSDKEHLLQSVILFYYNTTV